MPRNSSGVYTLPESAFVPNTPISSAAVNDDFSDIADAMTDSLSRNGQGGMNAQLGLALTGFNYSSDPDTGISRSAANTQVVTCGGQNWTFTATDLTAPDGSSLAPLIGEVRIWALPSAPSGWVLLYGQACTTSYPLWRAALIAAGNPYGTSGGDPLFPDLRSAIPLGPDNMGGIPRGIISTGPVGSFLGAATVTLQTSNLPPYTPAGSVPISNTLTAQTTNPLPFQNGVGPFSTPTGGVFWGNPAQQPITFSGSISASFTGTAQGGTSAAVSVVQPSLVINFIGRAA